MKYVITKYITKLLANKMNKINFYSWINDEMKVHK